MLTTYRKERNVVLKFVKQKSSLKKTSQAGLVGTSRRGGGSKSPPPIEVKTSPSIVSSTLSRTFTMKSDLACLLI